MEAPGIEFLIIGRIVAGRLDLKDGSRYLFGQVIGDRAKDFMEPFGVVEGVHTKDILMDNSWGISAKLRRIVVLPTGFTPGQQEEDEHQVKRYLVPDNGGGGKAIRGKRVPHDTSLVSSIPWKRATSLELRNPRQGPLCGICRFVSDRSS
jgi:hypothetical protein